MTIKYKLVTQDYTTRVEQPNETKWQIGVRVEAKGFPSQDLCSDAWVHAYDDPVLAVMMNPIHANIANPRLLEVECEGGYRDDDGLKCGYRAMTPVREVEVPQVTTEQRVRFAICCALEVYSEPKWVAWARDWLDGKDRTKAAADAADAADAATYAAADATADATDATYAAADAAYAAADAAYAANYAANADSADSAAYAADAANYAATYAAYTYAANYAATYAAYAADSAAHTKSLDLVALAHKAIAE